MKIFVIMFPCLPVTLLFEIQSFLSTSAFDAGIDSAFTCFDEDSEWSWRNFLAANNEDYWKSIRKETMIWSLNEVATIKFTQNKIFREHILKLVASPNHQIQLHFDNYPF